jgi:hypothetical protein
MEDFKIYIFVIQKSFLCSLGEISLVYNLHKRRFFGNLQNIGNIKIKIESVLRFLKIMDSQLNLEALTTAYIA